MRSPRTATVATLLAVSLLAACGDGDGDSDAVETETVTETASSDPTDATTTATEPTTSAPMDPTETGDVTLAQVEAALLSPEEIAPGLEEDEWTDDDSPPPCDPSAAPTDETVPPAVQAGIEIDTTDGNASVTEEIAIYDTEAEAAQAFALGSEGLNCPSAELPDGTTVTIGPATDVTAQVNTTGIGSSTAWELGGDGFTGALVATIAGRVIVASTFFAAEGADTSNLPTPIEIAERAFAKALAN